MSAHATKLRVGGTGRFIAARLHDDLALNDLFDAEAVWAPARVRVLQALAMGGVEPSHWPQSLHWSWAKKAAEIPPARLGPPGDLRLFGIRAKRQWQGILLAKGAAYKSRLGHADRPIVYVDYVESAPWNWELPEIDRTARYRTVGMQLIETAVRWSRDLGYGGRLGLHALAQADQFYRIRCGMSDLGADSGYHGMLYFEFDEDRARTFLETRS